jgi:glycosyltransferase involved in cell wall biosynthesis
VAVGEQAAEPARRRILLLTPRWPYPPIGGDRLRILKLAEEVARHHDVTLLSLCQTESEFEAPLPCGSPFAASHKVLMPRWRSWMQMVAALTRPMPLQVAYYSSAAFRREVQRLAKSHDLLWCHLVRTAPYAANFTGPRWLEMTDAISLTMERAALNSLSPWDPRWWLFRLESRRMHRMEQAVQAIFDLVSLVSSIDCDAVRSEPSTARMTVAPNGVDIPASPGRPTGERPPNMVMIGRMDSIANRDALWHFVRDILPGILARVPNAMLRIVGHVEPRDARRLRRIDRVRIEGVVPELQMVLESCRVGICPVRIGSGMQNKVLDYMAHGVATVTSSLGHEGIDAQPGQDLEVADTPAEWIERVSHLLTEPGAATSLGAAGRALVERRYRWPEAIAPIMLQVDSLLAGSTASVKRRPAI